MCVMKELVSTRVAIPESPYETSERIMTPVNKRQIVFNGETVLQSRTMAQGKTLTTILPGIDRVGTGYGVQRHLD